MGEVIIQDELVEYSGEGVTLKAHVSIPQGVSTCSAVIVIQEWWGLNDHLKDVARRVAREGYVTIAPDLYSRLGHKVTTDPQEAGQLMGSLSQEDGLKDLTATIKYVRGLREVAGRKIGVIGFCMGGGYALMLPCVSTEISAAVPFYGPVPNPDTPLQQLAAPVLYVYGEDDGWITHADVDRLKNALAQYQKPGEVKTYPGCPHAFFNDTRLDVFKPQEAADAWNRTSDFFHRYL